MPNKQIYAVRYLLFSITKWGNDSILGSTNVCLLFYPPPPILGLTTLTRSPGWPRTTALSTKKNYAITWKLDSGWDIIFTRNILYMQICKTIINNKITSQFKWIVNCNQLVISLSIILNQGFQNFENFVLKLQMFYCAHHFIVYQVIIHHVHNMYNVSRALCCRCSMKRS